MFRQTTMKEGETTDQYMVRLRKQARYCNFGDNLSDNLRDQLIEQIKNIDLKKKLLETRNITLEQALEKARAWETANLQASEMTGSVQHKKDEASVNAVKRNNQDKKVKCYNYGKEGHMKLRDKNCPAKGKKCGKYGHFAVCCKGQTPSNNNPGNEGGARGGTGGREDNSDVVHLTVWRMKSVMTMHLHLRGDQRGRCYY